MDHAVQERRPPLLTFVSKPLSPKTEATLDAASALTGLPRNTLIDLLVQEHLAEVMAQCTRS